MHFLKKHILIIVSVFILAGFQGVVCYVTFFRPTGLIMDSATKVYQDVFEVKTYGTQRNFDLLPGAISSLRTSVGDLLVRIENMNTLNYVPIVRPLHRDLPVIAEIIDEGLVVHQDLIENIAPFAFALGLDANGGEGQYLENFLKISPQVIPIIDTYLTDIVPVIALAQTLSVETYPNIGVPIRDYVTQGVEMTQSISENIPHIKEFVTQLPDLMGVQETKRYLVLFQNDKEIRPTGGFITSFTILNSNSGEISFSEAKNIYEVPDDSVYYTPPAPIVRYLTETAWHMRDTNFSPDYKESMDMFHTYWKQIGQEPVDGIIAIDTQFVSALLEYTGNIEIPDYSINFALYPYVPESCKDGGTTFTPENVVCRLEFYSSQLTSDQALRKDVIGALMKSLFEKVMAADSTQWYPLLTVITKQLNEKHLLLYFVDPQLQRLSEDYNFAGRIITTNDDYVHVNDANLAGLKSDMYLKRSVEQRYSLSDEGNVTKTVKLTYENTGAFDGWLNATARNYVRLYVPEGSRLIETTGGEAVTSVSTDLGKTVFDNFVRVPAMSSSTVSFTYELPDLLSGELSSGKLTVQIQKQPGKDVVAHTIFVNDTLQHTFDEVTDTSRVISW